MKPHSGRRLTTLQPWLTICSWCQQVRTSSTGAWHALHDLPAQKATHGICPACYRQQLSQHKRG